eukprot:ctg_138.g71
MSTRPLSLETKQFLSAVEPSLERGINLGLNSLIASLQEYELLLGSLFEHKLERLEYQIEQVVRDQLQQTLRHCLLNLTLVSQLNNFDDRKVFHQSRSVWSAEAANKLKQTIDSKIAKTFKDSFMDYFVSETESCCRRHLHNFSLTLENELSQVFKDRYKETSSKLSQLQEKIEYMNSELTDRKVNTSTFGQNNRVSNKSLNMSGVVDIFWRKVQFLLDKQETGKALLAILDSGLPQTFLNELLSRFTLQVQAKGLKLEQQEELLDISRLQKLLSFFAHTATFPSLNIAEWLKVTMNLAFQTK